MRHRGPSIKASVIISTLVIGLAAASGIIPFRHVLAHEQSVALAMEQRDALVEENMRLEAQIAALQTPAEVERLAREHFGLVMPGEVAYVATPVDDPSPPPEVFTRPEPPQRWWESIWDFLTGADLVDDG